jgi:acyl transferase domain-containing protein
VAVALDLPFARLQLPYASHHPAMRPAVGVFVDLMGQVRQRRLRLPVISPIHRRRYTDDDDLRLALAECLVLPVRFTDTVRWLHARRYTTFVEAGALNALTRCVELTVPGVRTAAPLADPAAETDGLRAAAELCGAEADQPATAVPPPRGPAAADAADAVVAPVAAPRDAVLDELRRIYAKALEYPVDVLTDDAQLEGDLGVDSLKQTSLLARVADRFGLPDGLRVWELPTLGHIADHVLDGAGARS